jgi:hypothetical protein
MLELFKRPATEWHQKIFIIPNDDADRADDAFERIRCPLCEWRPTPASTWCCVGQGTPEPPFQWCGTIWNTFSTRGRCPGCAHQWKWTSCLRCGGFSLHEDWYECG